MTTTLSSNPLLNKKKLQVYTTPNYWDCVATCFFIDCANNVAEFVETIYKWVKVFLTHYFIVFLTTENEKKERKKSENTQTPPDRN